MTNKNFIAVVSVLVALCAGALIWWPQDKPAQTNSIAPAAKAPVVDGEWQKIQYDLRAGALLVDVRTAEEYATEHAEGAKNLALADIETGKVPSDDKSHTIYVYCRSGKRAGVAKGILEQAGYKVVSLGGLNDWIAMGGVTKKGV